MLLGAGVEHVFNLLTSWMLPAAVLFGLLMIVIIAATTRNARAIASSIVMVGVSFILLVFIKVTTSQGEDSKFKKLGQDFGNDLGGGSSSGSHTPSPAPTPEVTTSSAAPAPSNPPDLAWIGVVFGVLGCIILVLVIIAAIVWGVRRFHQYRVRRREAEAERVAALNKRIEVLKGKPYTAAPEYTHTARKRTVRL